MMGWFKRNRFIANEAGAPAVAPAPKPGAGAHDLVGSLSRQASDLGREAAEVRGLIDDSNKQAQQQQDTVLRLRSQLDQINQAQQDISGHTHSSSQAVVQVRQALEGVGREVGAIVDTLRQVAEAAGQITQIAVQTRLVAFNASVEAKRAGDAGRGFGVVADAVRDLAGKVEVSSKDILGTVGTLDARIGLLAREIQTHEQAGKQGTVHLALAHVESGVSQIVTAAQHSQGQCQILSESMTGMHGQVQQTSQALAQALSRSETFLKISEDLLEKVAESGFETEDTPFIRAAQEAASEISGLLEAALAHQEIGMADLFDERYQPINGTNPPQHLTRFVALADRLFPQVQERLLSLGNKVVFCIAVDRNGYVATHNKQYCKPQRGDLAWDSANSRYRRIFNDRTGLGSARNQRPFLLQTYRRDMGGGRFVVMKEVAAPIRVQGKHWGGLRLAYQF